MSNKFLKDVSRATHTKVNYEKAEDEFSSVANDGTISQDQFLQICSNMHLLVRCCCSKVTSVR